MTLLSIHPWERKEGLTLPLDRELNSLVRLMQAMAEANIPVSPVSVTNLYVSLKSKPLALLVGPKDEPKEAFLRLFSAELTGQSPYQCQTMAGHAWWATRTDNVARFTQAQTALNEEKIAALLSEALQAQNAHEVFIACLMKISPAELEGCFSTLARLIQGRRVIPLPGNYYWPPFPCPPNLLIVGTMDAGLFPGYEADLLTQTTVITGAFCETPEPFSLPLISREPEKHTLSAWIRDEASAYARLHQIPGWHSRWLKPAMGVVSILLRHGVSLQTRRVTQEVLIYLANSWSQAGNGLFANPCESNLNTALDLAISQSLLSRGWEPLRHTPSLRQTLKEVLDNRFPRSRGFIEGVSSTR
ncbi:MAG TPA: hypothetical protein VI451_03350 [Anaerolineales bacterium]|nr:hypothetical protein [Anaerolineales bacterium]